MFRPVQQLTSFAVRRLEGMSIVQNKLWVSLAARDWRSSPLVFSLVPRCHGECGSQKSIAIVVAIVICRCWASSVPWSHVRVLTKWSERLLIGANSPSRTVIALGHRGGAPAL